jgi:putative nucleotidyltransferase with HDIG domain
MEQIKKLFSQISKDDEVIKVITNHSLRVMYLSNKLAKKMGCYSQDFRLAALLHDIGKIGLNRSILFKKEKLNDLEYTVIQSHSHIGNTILRKQLDLPKAAGFVRDHHERWDGKGYPRGLKGDHISTEGRIIGICDAFDTMINERRTYRQETMSINKAFEELRSCSWKQFDGDLVDIFIDIIQKMNLLNPELWYKDPQLMKAFFEPQESGTINLNSPPS